MNLEFGGLGLLPGINDPLPNSGFDVKSIITKKSVGSYL
jgi:hypothetical protein